MAKIDRIAGDETTIDDDTARNYDENSRPGSATAIIADEQPIIGRRADEISDREILATRRRANARAIKNAIGSNP